jgi:hypothetical protein
MENVAQEDCLNDQEIRLSAMPIVEQTGERFYKDYGLGTTRFKITDMKGEVVFSKWKQIDGF